ncbi:MAG: DnaJ family domain-containing protein [Chloroflexota bacterium]|nr:DUF1992 domain-containing protein [Chloroflexota bacterium]
MSERFDNLVERRIRDARDKGKFDNLANQGQPIKIEEENPYLDEEWRVAYKVVENSGFVPAWVELDKEVEYDLVQVRRNREEHRRWLLRRLDDIKNGPTQYFARDLRRLHQHHQSFLKNHACRLDEVNNKIERFNYICPVNNLLKIKIQTAELIQEFDHQCPAIPLL